MLRFTTNSEACSKKSIQKKSALFFMILMWIGPIRRKKDKEIVDPFKLTQCINGPTRITQSSKTQIDLIFSNRPERIAKSLNFLKDLSDHNMTLISRKLSKNIFVYHKKNSALTEYQKEKRMILRMNLNKLSRKTLYSLEIWK